MTYWIAFVARRLQRAQVLDTIQVMERPWRQPEVGRLPVRVRPLAATRTDTLVQMPSLNPVLLSDARILAAHIIFIIGSYLVFALGRFPWMKIDRPGAAIIGAVLMIAFRVVGTRDAAGSIDFATIKSCCFP